MFEKDEDYRKARKESKHRITEVIKVWSAREETLHDEGFQKGAEFGYNKANEWHYPSKGECPKEYKDILICFLTEDDMKDCVRGWYEYDLDEDEHYFKTVNTFGTAVIKNVYAWKEIVLPELKESE